MKFIPCTLTAVILFGVVQAAEKPHEITLPPETEIYPMSELPGASVINANCLTCHSIEYSTTQPPTSTRAYWQATVVKMQKVFGAPIADANIELLVDYLVKSYGNEKPAAPAAK